MRSGRASRQILPGAAECTGKIAQSGVEKPLRPSNEKVGIVEGFGCFPEKVTLAKNTGTFIPDDFEHEIATIFVFQGKGLVVLTSCSHRGVIDTVRQAQAASGVEKVHAIIGGFHIVPPLDDNYTRQVIAAFKEINPDCLIPGIALASDSTIWYEPRCLTRLSNPPWARALSSKRETELQRRIHRQQGDIRLC